MQPLLQNLVEMTALRDHLRLEVSVVSTLLSLSGVEQVRALEIFLIGGEERFTRARSQSVGKKVQSSDVDAVLDPHKLSLQALPKLQHGLQQQQSLILDEQPGRHVLWLPLWRQEMAHTCIEITQAAPFSKHRLDVIQGIFGVYQNYQSLLDYSERDALTGLLNRKTFDEHFLRLSMKAIQDSLQKPSSDNTDKPCDWLAAIDIDHFKRINDRFGHLYGDEVLILVANILRSAFAARDKVFRFGGEEFIILLRSASRANACKALERLRNAVQNYPFPQVGQVTVSIGFTAIDCGAPVEVLGQADQALYHAKEHGRNQTCLYEELIEQGLLEAKVMSSDVELF